MSTKPQSTKAKTSKVLNIAKQAMSEAIQAEEQAKQAEAMKNAALIALEQSAMNALAEEQAKQAEEQAEAEALKTDDERQAEAEEQAKQAEENRLLVLKTVQESIDSYDGKPLSVQLAEVKFSFDAAKSQAGKYKNKTGESELSAKEFMTALLTHCTLDGIHPTTDFQAVCKAIADKRERPKTKEERQAEAEAEALKAKQAEAKKRQGVLDQLIIAKANISLVKNMLDAMGAEPLTEAETALFTA